MLLVLNLDPAAPTFVGLRRPKQSTIISIRTTFQGRHLSPNSPDALLISVLMADDLNGWTGASAVDPMRPQPTGGVGNLPGRLGRGGTCCRARGSVL